MGKGVLAGSVRKKKRGEGPFLNIRSIKPLKSKDRKSVESLVQPVSSVSKFSGPTIKTSKVPIVSKDLKEDAYDKDEIMNQDSEEYTLMCSTLLNLALFANKCQDVWNHFWEAKLHSFEKSPKGQEERLLEDQRQLSRKPYQEVNMGGYMYRGKQQGRAVLIRIGCDRTYHNETAWNELMFSRIRK